MSRARPATKGCPLAGRGSVTALLRKRRNGGYPTYGAAYGVTLAEPGERLDGKALPWG